ncbi:tetratricopeptide repeat protein [Acidocella aromatica]|uniref:Tetratricopeptide repeat protein 38 n=1 Tax=Acidocella aromatica TaxID=1303579 RepID=A0A840VB36_9PROT|nr:tetratricopeptide repeat protein [Acidocella aromatica]MBB5372047.1 tetratricopeptide (TPR) repeat protein [Acidocella aromatica]
MSQSVRDAAFAQAVDEYLGWYGDPMASLNKALDADPGFLLGYTTFAALHSIGGTPGDAEPIQTALKSAEALSTSATIKEKLHLRAAQDWARSAITEAATSWELALAEDPHDLLALHLAHDTHFYLGDARKLRDVPLSVLPAQASGSKARGYVLGMAAFGLEESGDYEAAERAGREAVEINPADTWAIHAVAHVLEMQGRADEGIAWLRGLEPHWAPAGGLAVHQWWHLSLYLLEAGHFDEVLEIYDAHIRTQETSQILDLVDAAALLWRLELLGVNVGERWQALAPIWGRHAQEHVLAFNDVHIAFTLDSAGDKAGLEELEASLARYAQTGTENAKFTRETGLPLIHALHAFRRGDFARTVELLAPIRGHLKQIGGSNAQRDLFTQTLVIAAFRAGQPELAHQVIAERKAIKAGSPRAFAPYLAS